jgi:zinc/manganese transport system substrate-binding protein
MKKTTFLTFVSVILLIYIKTSFALLKVVAAENVYGSVAKQIGGEYVDVVNILNNPAQDPHLFSTTPNIAKNIADADIIIYNGASYDAWMTPLQNLQTIQQKPTINVAQLAKIPMGANPHIWYSPNVMLLFAKKITDLLIEKDPVNRSFFEKNYQEFLNQYQNILTKIQLIKKRFANTPIIATEPIFNEMTKSLGLIMHAENFQMKIMNDIPPSISEVKDFERDLRSHSVKVFIYNDQVINPLTTKMLDIAKIENIPIVGISELMPENMLYTEWLMQQLNALEKALEGNSSQ